MAKIYTEQATTQNLSPDFYSSSGNLGQSLMNKADVEDKQAEGQLSEVKSLYSLQVNSDAKLAMNELYNNPYLSANPQEFQKELQKVKENMVVNIADEDVQADFLVNFDLNGASYLNKTIDNFNRVQEEKIKSANFNTVYNAIDNINLSLANGINGNGNENDFVNARLAQEKIKQSIEVKNSDGTYMFSDAQRRAMINDLNTGVINGFKETFNNMPENKQEEFAGNLAKDEVVLTIVTDKDKNEIPIKLEDVVDATTYKDMKKVVNDAQNKNRANNLKEFNLSRRESHMNFLQNPSETTLNEYKRYHPDASNNTVSKFEEIVQSQPNYIANSVYDGVNDAKVGISEITSMPIVTDKDRADVLDNLTNYVLKLNRSNRQGKISKEDIDEFANIAYRSANDAVFKEQVNKIFNQRDIFTKITGMPSSIGRSKALEIYNSKRVENIGLRTIKATSKALAAGDVETAKKIYDEGQKEAINIRYGFNKTLNKDEIVNINGKAYKFLSYGLDDVFVEAQ